MDSLEVFYRYKTESDLCVFGSDPDGDVQPVTLFIPLAQWVNMGSPSEITLPIPASNPLV